MARASSACGASASCISHSRWGRGRGRGWMWQSQAQLVRLRLPPPSLRPEPWHPIHLVPANPRPNIPLRSGPACRLPLQYQVSVCFLASGWLCPYLSPRPLVPSGGGLLLHLLCSGAPCPLPRDSWLGRWCGEGGGVEGDRVLCRGCCPL